MEILRNLTRRKLRNALTVAGIMIGVLALTTMGAMAEKFNLLFDGGERFFSGHVVVNDPSLSGFGPGLIQVSRAADIARVDGVAGAFPNISLLAKADEQGSLSVPDQILGTAPGSERYETFKLTLAQGRDINRAASGEVAFGSDIAREFGVRAGDSITLPRPAKQPKAGFIGHRFRVVGIYDKTLTAPDSFAFVSFADAQQMFGENLPQAVRGQVDVHQLANSISVYGKPGINLDDLARRIAREVPSVHAIPPSTLVAEFKQGSLLLTAITTGSAVLALVVGGLSVVNTMLMAVTERVREIGLKKAVGAQTGHILREFLFEAILFGAIGGAAGLLLGWLTTVVINAWTASQNLSLFLLSGRLVLLAIVFSVGLGAVAGIIPAFRAARMDPVAALRAV
jgi:putative ABC transport system permease protein